MARRWPFAPRPLKALPSARVAAFISLSEAPGEANKEDLPHETRVASGSDSRAGQLAPRPSSYVPGPSPAQGPALREAHCLHFPVRGPWWSQRERFYFRSQEQPLAQTPTLDKLLPSRLKKIPMAKGHKSPTGVHATLASPTPASHL